MPEYKTFNILDLIDSIGEDEVEKILSDFSCPKNAGVSHFLKKQAIQFARQKLSVSFLVFDIDARLVGYFTLTHKPASVQIKALKSKSQRVKIERYARLEEKTQSYNVSSYLIAQIGKNYRIEQGRTISGDDLMDEAFNILRQVQRLIGGGVVFLECENKPSLLSFYQNAHNGFYPYGERIAKKEENGIKYIQLLKFF